MIRFKRATRVDGRHLPVPSRAHATDSGLDLCSDEPQQRLKPGQIARIATGWSVAVPAGFESQVRPRSGMASRGLVAILGTIDSGYRGEIYVTLVNLSGNDAWVSYGDKIAQLVVAPVLLCSAEEVTELEDTERGARGFGSTGT